MRPPALLLPLSLLVFAATASAQTVWTGNASTSWNNPGNWNPMVVPTAGTSVMIAPAANQPSSYITSPTCNNMNVQAGASLTLGGGFDLKVNGFLIIDGTLTVTATTSDVRVVGSWTNNGTFAHGGSTVTLDGAGALNGTSPTTFHDLCVSGGLRTTSTVFTVAGDVSVENGATFNIGPLVHSVAGNWTSSDPTVAVTGLGAIDFTGTGLLTTGSNSLPNMEVSGGLRSVNQSGVTGDLTLTGGEIMILDDVTFSVLGDADLTAGTLSWNSAFAGVEVLDVQGDVTCTATAGTTGPDVRFRCAGNWSSSSAFDMASGIVELDGGTTATVSGSTPTFPGLRIASGTKTVTSAAVIRTDLIVSAGATLDTDASLDVDRDVQLGITTASWDTGTLTHTVAGNWFSAGSVVSGAGTIEFDGDGSLETGAGSISNVLVSSGARSAVAATITGNLTMTGGSLDFEDNAAIIVSGNVDISGGTLNFIDLTPGFEGLNVSGDVTIDAPAGTTNGNSRIECAGSWSSTSLFAMADGTVALDGSGTTTIGGAGATLPDLEITGGTKTLTSDTTVTGDLTVSSGTSLILGAQLSLNGNVSLGNSTSTMDLGGNTLSVGLDLISAGCDVTNGTVEFDGTGTVDMGGGTLDAVSVTAGDRSAVGSVISNALSMTAGQLILEENVQVVVNGDANLVGGTLSFNGSPPLPEGLDINGNAVITAAAGSTPSSARIECQGDWTSSSAFAMTDGIVVLDGTGTSTVSGSAPTFANLELTGGTKNVTSAVTVNGDLTIGSGTAVSSTALTTVSGDVSMGDATSSWELNGLVHPVSGDWTSSGGVATGGGVEFTGDGTTATGTGSLPSMVVSSGNRLVSATTIDGDLSLTGGFFQVEDDQTVHVTGNATLSGGTVNWFPTASGGNEVLDVDGDVSCLVGILNESASSLFVCGGDWTSDASFAPTAATVELDGAGANTIGGTTPTHFNLRASAGTKTVTTSTVVAGDLEVLSGAALVSGAALDVNGSMILGDATASWDMANFPNFVAGDFTSAGANVAGTGTLVFDGNGAFTSAGTVTNVGILGGNRALGDATITGMLTISGGELEIQDNQTAAVAGNLVGNGGVLSFDDTSAGPETLDVGGNVILTGTTAGSFTDNSRIECGADWSSTSAFAPTAGTVSLDKPGVGNVLGSTPTFADLEVASGIKNFTVDGVITGDLLVMAGSLLQTIGTTADVGGDVTIEPTAGWDLGNLPQTVGGSWSSDGGTILGTAAVEFDGDGTVNTGSSALPGALVSAGTRTALDTTITGSLSMTGGGLVIGDNQTLSVGGDLDLTGGTLSFDDTTAGLEVLDVDGDVTMSIPAGAMSASSRIECAGDWTSSSFSPTDGVVALDGGTAATLGGTFPTFATLEIVDGVKTVVTNATVTGSLDVLSGAMLDTDASLDVDGSVTLGDATAAWDIGAFTHTVAGDLTSAGASATGTGTIQFDGPGTLATTGALPNILISSDLRTVMDAAISGQLSMTGGELLIEDNQTLAVSGSALLSGGTLSMTDSTAGDEVLDIEGDVNVGAASGESHPSSLIRCAGNWTSSATFAPAAGVVVLDGGGPGTIGGTGITLADLRIESGAKTLGSDITLQNLEISSGAGLVSNGVADVGQAVTLGDGTASWDLGGLVHTVAGTWTSAGAQASNGTIELTGVGDLDTGAGSIDNVTISGGDRQVFSSTIDGTLELQSGNLRITDDQTLNVLGDALLTGGTISWFFVADGTPEVLDVDGDVICTSAAGTSSSDTIFRCGGDWSSNSNFDPTFVTLELDGAGPTLLSAEAPGFDPTLQKIVIRNGQRTVTTGMTIDAAQITVEPGAALDITGLQVVVPGTTVFVDGALSIGAGGTLMLGATSVVAVNASGLLSLVGSALEDATLTGVPPNGGYLISINGTLEAANFQIEGMASSGIIISNSAVIAPYPNDLRGGTFSLPASGAGSVMLDIRRDVPTEFRYVDFQDPLGVGTFNVRTLSGAPITFVNSLGNFTGPAFEQDPFGLIDWDVELTVITGYAAVGGPDRVDVSWTSIAEVDVASFVVQRSTGGPFVQLAELAATGPGPYLFADTAVTPQQTYSYRLLEKKTHGPTNQLGQATATPWSAGPPSNFLTVGAGGQYADIQAALAALSGGKPVISVGAGTYPSFTVQGGFGATVRIYGDGSGPVIIDTTTGPVLIQDLVTGDILEMSDLTIGDPASPSAGVVVQNCIGGVVVLDELTVHGGVGQPGVLVSGSNRVAIQRTDMDGVPGLRAESGSTLIASRGSLDDLELTGNSKATTCQLPTSATVDPGSTLTELFGVMPNVDIPEFPSLGTVVQIQLEGVPGGVYDMRYSQGMGWQQIGAFEMIALINPLGAQPLASGVLTTGSATINAPLPPQGTLFGLPLSTQMIVTNGGLTRFSNVATVIPVD